MPKKAPALAKMTISGYKLKALRLRKKVTQEQLAKAIGTQHTAISRMEQRPFVPQQATLKKLCDFFQVKPEELSDTDTTKAIISVNNAKDGLNQLVQAVTKESTTKQEMLIALDLFIQQMKDIRTAIETLPEEMLIPAKTTK